MFTISRFDTGKTFICKTLVNCEFNAFKKACKAWTQTLSVHVTKRPQSATFCSFFHYKLVSLQKGLHHSLHNNHCITGLFTFSWWTELNLFSSLTWGCPSRLWGPGPPAPGWSALRSVAAARPPRAPVSLPAHACRLCRSPVWDIQWLI